MSMWFAAGAHRACAMRAAERLTLCAPPCHCHDAPTPLLPATLNREYRFSARHDTEGPIVMSDADNAGLQEKPPAAPRFFSRTIFVVFIWVMFGICGIYGCGIYGVRLWFNSVPNPVFIPIISATFCATLSFTIVLFLETVSGPIQLKLREGTEFSGASGPIIMWCLCFSVIAFGLYLLGTVELIKLTPQQTDHRAVHQLATPLPKPP